jgi:hypothetical protein
MGTQRGRRTRLSWAQRLGRRGRRPYNRFRSLVPLLSVVTAFHGFGPCVPAPEEGRYRGSAGHRRRDPGTAAIPDVGATAARIGELHRRAVTTRAIAHPPKQVRPFLQTLPQAPQLLLSQQVATQAPLQFTSPSAQQSPLGQSQIPSKQLVPEGQALPQAPQWLLLQQVSTQIPSHSA